MIELVITTAGKEAIVNAQQTGLNSVVLSHIAVGTGKYTPYEAQTRLQNEIKRLEIIEGGSAGDNSIHIAFMDDSPDAYAVNEIGVFTDGGVLFAVASSQTAYIEKGGASSVLLAVDIAINGFDISSISFGDLTYSNAAATTTNAGVLAVATNDEAAAGVATQKAITPSNLAFVLNARMATAADALDDSNNSFLTPAALSARTATTGRAGLVEFATNAETAAGADATRAVTAAGLNYTLQNYTGNISGGAKVTAAGATAARALNARFADSINPKDYGAAADGTTNDNAAFAALEAAVSGRDIDLEGAVYLVDSKPAGNNYYNGAFKIGSNLHKPVYDFYKFGGTAPRELNVLRDFTETQRGGAALLAKDYIRSGTAAGAVVQSAVWDDVNRYFYTLHTTTTDYAVVNRFSGMKFGANIENTASAYTAASQYIGHQGLGIEYMTGGAVKLWGSMSYETAGADVSSKGTKAVRFNAPSTTSQNVDSTLEIFNLFPEVANSSQATTVCTSYSGRYLIAKYNEANNVYWVRIFKLSDLTTAGDYSNKFIHEFRITLTRDTSSGPARALQGMACDDQYIYFLAASYGYAEKHSIYISDMFGNIVDEYRDLSAGKELGVDAGTTYYEPQSLFFMSLNGVKTLVMQIATGDNEGDRLCHLIALNRRQSYYFPVGTGTDNYNAVAIDEQGRIVNAEGNANISLYPSGLATFLQARAGANQATFARFSNDDAAAALVLYKSRGADVGESKTVLADDKIGQIHFMADNGNIDYSGTVQGARVGYISCDVFDSSTITSAGTTGLGIRGAVRIYACSDATDRTGRGIEILDNSLRPTADDALNLGTAGRRWKAVHAITDVISTSDERAKCEINDIPDNVLKAWERVNFKQFRFKDIGDDRIYFGVVAQHVIKAFEAEGLNAFDYGLVSKDTTDEGNELYSIRYKDVQMLEAACMRKKIAELEALLK